MSGPHAALPFLPPSWAPQNIPNPKVSLGGRHMPSLLNFQIPFYWLFFFLWTSGLILGYLIWNNVSVMTSGSLDVWQLFSGHTAVMIIYLHYLIQEFMYLDNSFHCVSVPLATTLRTTVATAPSTAGKPKVKWTPEVSCSFKAGLKHLWEEEKV